jgi:hypothetical protein
MESVNFELSIFSVGVGIGLAITLLVWISKVRVRSSLRKEIEDLKKQLYTQMSINAKGYGELTKDLESLRKENENLRITIATLSNKPGRAELKTLHAWDKAIRTLNLKLPGFAPAWELAITEANKEVEETNSGVKALVRRVFPLLPPDLNRTEE